MPPRSRRSPRRRHPRAVAVTLAGVVALVAAGGFGTPTLQPLGVGLVVAGVGALAIVEICARALRLTRSIDRDTVSADDRIVIVTTLVGWPARSGLLRLLDWDLRAGAPQGARTEVRRPRRTRDGLTQEIIVYGLRRGVHELQAPSVGLSDPFGLARLRRASTASGTVTVLPSTVPVLLPFWESGAARRAGQSAGLLRGRAELGGVRDYEPGDPLSLIHWGQTARRGTLQTKELHGESGRGATLAILLDAAEGAGPPDAGRDDPFEVAVSAAASLVACCAARGDTLGLEHTGTAPRILPVGSPAAEMEKELATVAADGDRQASDAIREICSRSSVPRQLVVVSATLDRGLGRAAQQARGAGIAVAAVLVGPARVMAQEVRRSGAWVTEVAGRADLGAALEGGGHARVAV